MKKFLSKSEAKEKVEEFFRKIKSKNPAEVKKIQRLAKKYNIQLKEKRKTFCKKCLTPYVNPKTRINKKTKIVVCGKCGSIARWKLKQNIS